MSVYYYLDVRNISNVFGHYTCASMKCLEQCVLYHILWRFVDYTKGPKLQGMKWNLLIRQSNLSFISTMRFCLLGALLLVSCCSCCSMHQHCLNFLHELLRMRHICWNIGGQSKFTWYMCRGNAAYEVNVAICQWYIANWVYMKHLLGDMALYASNDHITQYICICLVRIFYFVILRVSNQQPSASLMSDNAIISF